MGIALVAGVLELATMLPYLAAIGLLTATAPALHLGPVQLAGLLVGYRVIMVIPALILLTARTVLATPIDPLLERLDGWFSRHC